MMKPSTDLVFSMHIQADHPACNGHFVGNPLLPGAMTLEYVRMAFRTFYPKDRIEAFRKVKFTHLLKPGERLDIYLNLESPGKFGFRCLDSQQHQIAIGQFSLGSP